MAARGAKTAAQGDLLPLQAPPSVAVILPCYNEEAAIGTTVAAFRSALPGAKVYVYDNNSSDRTVDFARAAGAIVRTERMQGKGHVVRRMFADVEADIYVMADGDATYDASAAPARLRRGAGPSSAPRNSRARAMSSAACSPTSRRTCTSWPTAT